MAKGLPKRMWTEAENAVVRARYPHEDTRALAADLGTTRDRLHQRAQVLGIRKTPEYLYQVAQHAGVKNGERSRFKKGQVPVNKGKPLREYVTDPASLGRIAKGQFKPGNRPHTHLPVGAYAQDDEGLWKIKISDHGSKAYGKHNRSHWDWRYLHRLVYEDAYGPAPKNEPIIFIDGNPDNCLDPDNLAHVTRAELARLNQSGFGQLPPDRALRRAAITEAKLRQAAHEAGKSVGLGYDERRSLIGGPQRFQRTQGGRA